MGFGFILLDSLYRWQLSGVWAQCLRINSDDTHGSAEPREGQEEDMASLLEERMPDVPSQSPRSASHLNSSCNLEDENHSKEITSNSAVGNVMMSGVKIKSKKVVINEPPQPGYELRPNSSCTDLTGLTNVEGPAQRDWVYSSDLSKSDDSDYTFTTGSSKLGEEDVVSKEEEQTSAESTVDTEYTSGETTHGSHITVERNLKTEELGETSQKEVESLTKVSTDPAPSEKSHESYFTMASSMNVYEREASLKEEVQIRQPEEYRALPTTSIKNTSNVEVKKASKKNTPKQMEPKFTKNEETDEQEIKYHQMIIVGYFLNDDAEEKKVKFSFDGNLNNDTDAESHESLNEKTKSTITNIPDIPHARVHSEILEDAASTLNTVVTAKLSESRRNTADGLKSFLSEEDPSLTSSITMGEDSAHSVEKVLKSVLKRESQPRTPTSKMSMEEDSVLSLGKMSGTSETRSHRTVHSRTSKGTVREPSQVSLGRQTVRSSQLSGSESTLKSVQETKEKQRSPSLLKRFIKRFSDSDKAFTPTKKYIREELQTVREEDPSSEEEAEGRESRESRGQSSQGKMKKAWDRAVKYTMLGLATPKEEKKNRSSHSMSASNMSKEESDNT